MIKPLTPRITDGISFSSASIWANTSEGNPSDFESAIKSMAKGNGFPLMGEDEKVPDYKQYVKIESVADGEIQITYKNSDGKEVRRTVVEGNPQYAEVKADLEVYEFVEETMNKKIDGETRYEIMDDPDKVPNPLYSAVIEPEGLGDKVLLVEYKDPETNTKKWGIAVKDLNPEVFDKVKDLKVERQKINEGNEAGSRLASEEDELPSSADITFFATETGNDDIILYRFIDENGEEQEGYVLESVNADLFEKVEGMRDRWVKQEEYLTEKNGDLSADDPEYVSVARRGNYWNKEDKTDSYFVDENAWMDVETVPELGDDALLVTQYDSEDRDTVRRKQIVYRDDIGDEKFDRLKDNTNHDEYIDFFTSHSTRPPSRYNADPTIQEWDSDRIKSSHMDNVSRVVTDFIDRGFILIEFEDSGSSKHVGKTFVISEKDHPEAFATARDHAMKDGTVKINLTSLGMDWINLRDKHEFPPET